jgi:hypothetical protein
VSLDLANEVLPTEAQAILRLRDRLDAATREAVGLPVGCPGARGVDGVGVMATRAAGSTCQGPVRAVYSRPRRAHTWLPRPMS